MGPIVVITFGSRNCMVQPLASRSLPSCLWTFSLLTVAAGCGSGRDASPVSGTVKVNGQPLADIRVSFEPTAAGAGLGSAGKTDASGHYRLQFVDNDKDGALLGKHKVMFFDLQGIPPGESPDAGPAPVPKTRLPKKYLTGGEEYDVKPGANQADFDLK